jgi:hypothetical protein
MSDIAIRQHRDVHACVPKTVTTAYRHEGHEDEIERELQERNLQYFIQYSTVAELSRYREEIIASFGH